VTLRDFRLVSEQAAVLLRIDTFIEATESTDALPGLAATARRIRDRLSSSRDAPAIGLYQAFGGSE
jgi:hypothetical protein